MSFKLDNNFLAEYKDKQPRWGPIGYVTYKRTYSRPKTDGTSEEYWETVQRVVEGTFNIIKNHCEKNNLLFDEKENQEEAQIMYQKMFEFKFTPPGRGFWMMGTEGLNKKGVACLMNCFSGDTKFYTKKGIIKFKDVIGETVDVLCPDNKYRPAIVKNYGKQKLQKVILRPYKRRSNYTISFDVTPNHRWILSNGETTTDLKVGDIIKCDEKIIEKTTDWDDGFTHGLIFGDGSRHTYYPERHYIRLCNQKDVTDCSEILERNSCFKNKKYSPSHNGDPTFHFITKENWKDIPYNKSNEYIHGFISGWIQADGWSKKSGTICLDTTDTKAKEWLFEHGPMVGYYITGENINNLPTNYGSRNNPLYRISLTTKTTLYNVAIIVEGNEEDVFCVEEPETKSFVLNYGIPTGNCAFVSTENLHNDYPAPFTFLMDMSMLGVGVGGDTKGAGQIKIISPQISEFENHVVEDTREGWVELIERILNAYAGKDTLPKNIDYSKIRPEGALIKTFGGTSSGPKPLIELVDDLKKLLDKRKEEYLTSSDITDIFNMIGKCVVSGNIRRSAEIMLGEPDDEEFLNLKNPEVNQEALYSHRWASNNSISVEVGQNYEKIAELTAKNGEPGYFWIDNAKYYGLMNGRPDNKDLRAMGTNPCQPANATLLSPQGITTMGDVQEGSIIWSGNKWTKILKKWSTGVKPVYRYHTTAGTFLGTENHRIVSEGIKIPVGEAESIDTSQGPRTDFCVENEQKIIDGLVLGDGTTKRMSERDYSYTLLNIGEKDQDYFEYFPKDTFTLFDQTEYRVGTTIKDLPYTYERVVPDKYYYGNEQTIKSFLKGLYSANGSICGNRITLKATSKKLILQVQEMLSSIGIKSYYTTNKAKRVMFDNGQYLCKESYDLNISSDREIFRRDINFIQKYKHDKLREICENTSSGNAKKTYDIIDVEYVGEEEVFDITVEDEKHTYWTGGLLVSNCSEQTLESYEMCNLVETYPSNHDTLEEWIHTLKYAYLYAKTVTLLSCHHTEANQIMMRNRRIGCSITGITQAFKKFGRRKMFDKMSEGYERIQVHDKEFSELFGVPKSIKTTSIKPSGTVSLLSGVTPGIHYPMAKYYVRNIRFQQGTPLLEELKNCGYKIEKDKYSNNTYVVSFPVKEEYFDRSVDEVSMWEQLENTAQIQALWADNQVSVTINFSEEEAKDIINALELYENRLKSVSFLPKKDHGYEQAPYIPITEEEYKTLSEGITPIEIKVAVNDQQDKFCDGDKCTI